MGRSSCKPEAVLVLAIILTVASKLLLLHGDSWSPFFQFEPEHRANQPDALVIGVAPFNSGLGSEGSVFSATPVKAIHPTSLPSYSFPKMETISQIHPELISTEKEEDSLRSVVAPYNSELGSEDSAATTPAFTPMKASHPTPLPSTFPHSFPTMETTLQVDSPEMTSREKVSTKKHYAGVKMRKRIVERDDAPSSRHGHLYDETEQLLDATQHKSKGTKKPPTVYDIENPESGPLQTISLGSRNKKQKHTSSRRSSQSRQQGQRGGGDEDATAGKTASRTATAAGELGAPKGLKAATFHDTLARVSAELSVAIGVPAPEELPVNTADPLVGFAGNKSSASTDSTGSSSSSSSSSSRNAGGRGMYVYLDWPRPSSDFALLNYRSLESVLAVWPNAKVIVGVRTREAI
jgi:hypothetical protein